MAREILVVACLVCSAWAGPAYAFQLPADVAEQLDAPGSRYKVSPEMAPAIQALFAPHVLDGTLPGGWVFDGITIEKFFIRLVLKRGAETSEILVLPPVLSLDGAVETGSFVITVENRADNRAAFDALAAALAANDKGDFWPDAAVLAPAEGKAVPQAMRKVHFTELLGDFFLVLLIVAIAGAAPAFRKAFTNRSLGWWWSLVGLGLLAAAVRGGALLVLGGPGDEAVWTPAAGLPQSSLAWFLNTASRFFLVNLDLVVMLNIAVGVATVLTVFLSCSLVFAQLLPAFVAGLFVATLPAHVALSASTAAMVPVVGFLCCALLCEQVSAATGEPRPRLLGALLALFAALARPEAWVFIAAILVFSVLRTALGPAAGRDGSLGQGAIVPSWKAALRPGFLLPAAVWMAVIGLRLAVFPPASAPGDRFLPWETDAAGLPSILWTWARAVWQAPLAAMLLWAAGLAVRPWRTDRAFWGLTCAWLVLAVLAYCHVDLSVPFRGGRVFLMVVPPLAFLAGAGMQLVARLPPRLRLWTTVIVVGWLALAPAIHLSSLREDYKADFDHDFLSEL